MAAVAPETKRKTSQVRQRTRIDWGAARAAYIGHGPENRSLARIAREFGVSEVTVQKWAARDHWYDAAVEADNEVARRIALTQIGALEERNLDTIRVAIKARQTVLADGVELDPKTALQVLPRLATLEQLFAGRATSHVEVQEVSAVVMACFSAAGEFVPADRRAEFMARFDAALGGLVALEEADAA